MDVTYKFEDRSRRRRWPCRLGTRWLAVAVCVLPVCGGVLPLSRCTSFRSHYGGGIQPRQHIALPVITSTLTTPSKGQDSTRGIQPVALARPGCEKAAGGAASCLCGLCASAQIRHRVLVGWVDLAHWAAPAQRPIPTTVGG